MSNVDRGVAPSILAAIHSPRWASQVQRGIESLPFSPPVQWLLDIEAARAISISNRKAVLIVECQETFPANPKELLNSMLALCNNAQNSPIFLLGDQTTEPWRNLLLEAGATEVCTSILDFESMWQRVTRHLKISTSHELSVEQTVSARLPW